MTLPSLLDNPYVIYAGWSLLVILWETSLVAALLAGWWTWRPRAAAARRYRAAIMAFGAAVVIAAVTPLALCTVPAPTGANTAVSTLAARPVRDSRGLPREVALPSAGVPLATAPAIRLAPDAIAAAVAALWAVGVVLLLARLLGGWYVAASIRRRALPVANETARAAAERLSAEWQFSFPVGLLQSRHVEAPVVIGWRAPALVLPDDAVDRLSPDMVAAVLAHEFAHIERRDYVANLIQSVVELLLFFSPGMLWMSRRIREAREYCCDDVAVARCRDPKDYVQALTTLAALGTTNAAGPVMSAAGPRLITRVRRLLEGEIMPNVSTVRLALIAVVLVALTVTGAPVALATAARAPRADAPGESAGAAPSQDSVPYGYATEQEGSGVELQKFVSTPQEPTAAVTVRNMTGEPVVAVRFMVAAERWSGGGPRLPVRLFESETIPVAIAPGGSTEIAPHALTAEQLQALAGEIVGGRVQLFFGLRAVQYANGWQWSAVPNPAATSGPDALGMPAALIRRDVIVRDANRLEVAYGACRDERNRATSHGGVIALRNEPGLGARCENGRWVETRMR